VGDSKRLVFISYEDSEALGYATEAKRLFERCGCTAWVWHYDRPPIGNKHEVMVQKIKACDFFVYICTEKSDKSGGQTFERRMALSNGKPITILTFNPSFISDILEDCIYNLVSPETFSRECKKVAMGLHRQQRLGSPVAGYHREGEPLESA
jgi:hypothetical protein